MPSEAFPAPSDSIGAWTRFRKQVENADECLKPDHTMTAIASMAKEDGQHHLLIVYDLLSEYCHPNSASRTLDFKKRINTFGRFTIAVSGSSELSPAFRTVFSLWGSVTAPSCRAIDEALDFLSRCRKPMPDVSPSRTEPPIGGMPGVDEHGRRIWLRMGESEPLLPESPPELTPDQLRRIEAIHSALAEVDPTPLDDSIYLFRCEGARLEEELWIYERFVELYQSELARRNSSRWDEKSLIFQAILRGCMAGSVGELISIVPSLKALPELERLFESVRTINCSKPRL